jgi:hypothetical protein
LLLFFQLPQVFGSGDGVGVIFAEDFASAGETFAEESKGALVIAGAVQQEGQIVH